MNKGDTCGWSELPCIDWPPDVPPPALAEVKIAARYVTGTKPGCHGVGAALYQAALIPWLVGRLRYSGVQACRIAGMKRHMTRDTAAYALMTSPAGQAIAHRMTRHLREMRRAEME